MRVDKKVEPQVGKVYIVSKWKNAVHTLHGVELLLPSSTKKWHGYFERYPEYGEKLGARKVISVKEEKYDKLRVELSEDLYPDHP